MFSPILSLNCDCDVCSCIQSSEQVVNKMTKLSSNNKQMRLSIPQADSTLNFKGFSLADLREINEVRFKMALFRERINKKLFSMHIKAGRKIEAQTVTPILSPEKNWPNIQKDTDMKMMECRMCPRKANFPQQDIPKGNLDYFICRVSTNVLT